MQLKKSDVAIHKDGSNIDHIDVTLYFKGAPTPIKMCHCFNYLGGVDTFGNLYDMSVMVRTDLSNLSSSGVDCMVARDILDGSIDIFRVRDAALMFSMECRDIEGIDWVPVYDSTQLPTDTLPEVANG